MGKTLRRAILAIYNALGSYAFPEGKPNLNWGSGVYHPTISLNLTNLSASSIEVDGSSVDSMPADVAENLSLEFTLAIAAPAGTPSNLYVIDDDSVQVKMGGQDITSQVYDDSTGVISIDAVTDDIEIKASAITYVSSDLVFFLDGLNRGGQSDHWIDSIGNIDFALSNCTENTDNVQFNGSSSKGVSSGTLNVLYSAGSIESIFDVSASEYPTYPKVQHILTNNLSNGISMGLGFTPLLNNAPCYCGVNGQNNVDYGNEVTGVPGVNGTITSKQHIYYAKNSCYRDGVNQVTINNEQALRFMCDNTSPLSIGYRGRSLTGTPNENFTKGKIFMVRVYSRALTPAERTQNYKVDKKRYNLS